MLISNPNLRECITQPVKALSLSDNLYLYASDHGRVRRRRCPSFLRPRPIRERRQTLRRPDPRQSQADRIRFEPADHRAVLVAHV